MKGFQMPDRQTIERARRDKREGKAASTQAGEFIREEIHHIRQGKHGARSAKQVIAIGLSEARRAGVDLAPPKKGKVSEKTRRGAQRAYAVGHGAKRLRKPSAKRSAAILKAMKREGGSAASHMALSRHARAAASMKTAKERSAAARKAARTRAKHGR
jgi:hypothetical protein